MKNEITKLTGVSIDLSNYCSISIEVEDIGMIYDNLFSSVTFVPKSLIEITSAIPVTFSGSKRYPELSSPDGVPSILHLKDRMGKTHQANGITHMIPLDNSTSMLVLVKAVFILKEE